MSTFTFSLCGQCFDSLEEMGIIYHILIDLIIAYISKGKPIEIKLCSCHIQQPTLQIIYEMERRNFINFIETSPNDALIVPRGIMLSDDEVTDYFFCICKDE
jgi:hypothetical protein